MARTVHIAGMYKSGTSWLLQCLAAHPDVVAWREFDPIGAAYARQASGNHEGRLKTLFWTLRGKLDRVYGGQALVPRSADEAFSRFFLGTGWVPVNGVAKQEEVARLPLDDLEFLADELFRILERRPRQDDGQKYTATSNSRALGVANFKRGDLVTLMKAVAAEHDPQQLPRLFYKTLTDFCEPTAMVAFKAADQIMTLPELLYAAPDTRCIVIVRDARDAVVSAEAFQKLMRERETPWQDAQQPSFRDAVYSWALRASYAAKYSRLQNVYVLRYEDLIADFDHELAGVYRFLGLSADASIVERTRALTDFKLMSGGRAPGEEASSVFRKGVVGDWHTKLSSQEKDLAWRIARRQLKRFGYTKEGDTVMSPLLRRGAAGVRGD